jgi:hypothetical protein
MLFSSRVSSFLCCLTGEGTTGCPPGDLGTSTGIAASDGVLPSAHSALLSIIIGGKNSRVEKIGAAVITDPSRRSWHFGVDSSIA